MFEEVKSILMNYTDVEEITTDTALVADLGLSSFDMVAIVADFEDKYDIEIADRDIRQLITVNDILEYIKNKIQ